MIILPIQKTHQEPQLFGCNDKVIVKGSEVEHNRAVDWVLMLLINMYEDSFLSAAEELGYIVHPKLMDPTPAAAMWEEANVPLAVC